VPTSADTVNIGTDNINRTATIGSGGSAEASVVRVGIGWGAAGDQGGYGKLTLGDDAEMVVGGDLSVGHIFPKNAMLTQGANASVSVGGNLRVGGTRGGGTYIVPTTGTLTLTGGTSSIIIGDGSGASGAFTYNNPIVTLTVPGSVMIAQGTGTAGDQVGNGTLTVGDGAAMAIVGNLTVGNTFSAFSTGNGGVFNLGSGSSLTVTGATAIATASNSRGRLNLDGDAAVFHGNLAIGADGRLNHNSGAVHLPRQTTTSGTFAHTAGSLHFGIGGDPASGAFDKVTVNGGVMTLAGELQVELEGGYKPEQTNSYSIVTRSGGVLWGTFANAPVSGGRYRLGGMEAQVTYGADRVVLSEWREAPDGVLLIVR
jgi:hypothetical protein